jgi:hypothetical protein
VWRDRSDSWEKQSDDRSWAVAEPGAAGRYRPVQAQRKALERRFYLIAEQARSLNILHRTDNRWRHE